MNTQTFLELRDEVKADEGVKNEIYLDHLDIPTCGVGHMIKESDPEHGLAVGTHIDDERVNELFDEDMKVTLDECTVLYDNFYTFPDEVQKIIANMMFNIGRPRLTKFIKMREHVNNGAWNDAANEMLDSRWAKQVPNRANRLVERMRNVQS